MTTEKVEFELAEDVKEFIEHNPDVEYADIHIPKSIMNSENDTLLKTVKIISSPTKFISVEIVDEKFANEKL